MKKRVLVLGLDGLEPTIVDSMLQRSELPNFEKLRKTGCYLRVQTTYPAQTPVAWSSFATGTNPGGHGIFDFICRDPQTYRPDLALSRFEQPKNMFSQPRIVNRRRGTPVWKVLAKAGVPSTVLRFPCTFPPDTSGARILAGIGVPDIRGGQGTGTYYTQDQTAQAHEYERIIHLDAGNDLRCAVIGPRDTRTAQGADLTSELRVRVDAQGRKLWFETGGASAVEVAERSWGPWMQVRFKVSMLQSINGIVRFYVRQVSPRVEFYASPVNFDPASPVFPISAPPGYAKHLADRLGLFSTLGMAEDHNGLDNGRFDEAAFLTQCDSVCDERERMMWRELEGFDHGFFFVLFDAPDRIQHMFWRGRDPEHPGFEPELTARFDNPIEQCYVRCDKLVGRLLEYQDENTLLIALSDHGFGPFRRCVDTNTWLWQQGLLGLRDNRTPGREIENSSIDWSKTFAYAVGLGGIYLNLRGRESGGIVEEGSEAERVRQTIETGLCGIVDPQTCRPAVAGVVRRERIYSGPYVGEAPDLLVNFRPGFRVSWQSSLGGFADHLFEDNTRRWSGDHIVDPPSVPGVLFMNRSSCCSEPQMVDLAPTILRHLDVPTHEAMEGKCLNV
jgi:predicted AlkP superfamily phosphohydrolase/phosphomutase